MCLWCDVIWCSNERCDDVISCDLMWACCWCWWWWWFGYHKIWWCCHGYMLIRNRYSPSASPSSCQRPHHQHQRLVFVPPSQQPITEVSSESIVPTYDSKYQARLDSIDELAQHNPCGSERVHNYTANIKALWYHCHPPHHITCVTPINTSHYFNL